jgi:hypothetical protein
MEQLSRRTDLSASEWMSLRAIVSASFMSRGSLPAETRARLVEMGLIQNAMGGVMPTPAGRIAARQ